MTTVSKIPVERAASEGEHFSAIGQRQRFIGVENGVVVTAELEPGACPVLVVPRVRQRDGRKSFGNLYT